jgi:nitroreductase
MSTILDTIYTRRTVSIRNLGEPAPRGAALDAIITAGAAAPDHGKLVPFRFIEVGEGARPRLASVWEAAVRAIMPEPSEQDLAKARDRATRAPVLLALVARLQPAHPKIVIGDQWLTVGCALQNMLLAAEAQGYSAAIISGPALDTPVMRDALGVTGDERLVSFVGLGTAMERLDSRVKPALEQVFSRVEV